MANLLLDGRVLITGDRSLGRLNDPRKGLVWAIFVGGLEPDAETVPGRSVFAFE